MAAPNEAETAKKTTDTQNSTDRAGDEEEGNICVICMEPLGTDTVNMGCAHHFHGQCLVNHLLRSTRCPICRHDGFEQEYNSEPEPEEEGERVTYKTAMKNAKERRTLSPSKVSNMCSLSQDC